MNIRVPRKKHAERVTSNENYIRNHDEVKSLLEDFPQLKVDIYAYIDGEVALQFYTEPRHSVLKETTIISKDMDEAIDHIAIINNILTFVEDNKQVIPDDREPSDED